LSPALNSKLSRSRRSVVFLVGSSFIIGENAVIDGGARLA
jgi:hypothetical protein